MDWWGMMEWGMTEWEIMIHVWMAGENGVIKWWTDGEMMEKWSDGWWRVVKWWIMLYSNNNNKDNNRGAMKIDDIRIMIILEQW
jgi:hypothetical protein